MTQAQTPPLAPLLIPARLRHPGSPEPTSVAPPQIHDADAHTVLGNARLVTLYDQASWSEGPTWWERERTLVWSDIVGRRVLGWREDGAVDVLLDATPFINGNAVLPDGTLVHCEHGRRAISRSDGKGAATPVAWVAEGSRLNAPNDLIVAPDGAIWFSDPTFGLENPRQGVPGHSESGRTAICRIGNDGEVQRMVDMAQPNGLAFSPDQRTLYASQTPEHGEGEVAIYAFDWDGTTLSNRRRFATVAEGVPDGFTVDRRGWLWSSSAKGVEIFDPAGTHLATVPTPETCSNCTFDNRETRLFVTGGAHLWMLSLT
ncbi:SMP-30/gluconolactonase/LRE family protein [Sphingomonas yabuuchiae]|uniref:SMP-30/gluconolactonase/LRE family protein n=1 Tax=Sphingomonas yabuuchiae TaxID=172044 RepID=UPI003D95453A